ncbi:methyltransferase domain-containing protein [Candidatus Bathyarchaeota archaeon]|nr:methyltransferase domain-containing protein [Candidatus Bathyarchaeota archaeon]
MDDCTQPWTFKPDSLDYIHLRYLTGCIKDWPALFKEAFRCATPEGYVESYDGGAMFYSDDDTLKEHHALAQWGKLFNEGGKKLGQTFDIVVDDIQRDGMEDAGLVVVGSRELKVGCPSRHLSLNTRTR